MSVRISSNQLAVNAANYLQEPQQQLNQFSTELGTGLKVNQPMDDPSGESQIVDLNSQIERDTGFTAAAQSGASQLSLSSQILGQAYSVLQSAQSAALQGLNQATVNQSDMNDLASQVDQALNQMLSLANTQQGGRSLFAGYQTATQAFATTTNASGQVSAVTYQGDSGVSQAQVGENMSVAVNIPGNGAFDAAGASTFQSLIAVRDALQAGDQTALKAGLTQLQAATTTVSGQESRAGALQASLQSRQTALGAQQNTLSAQLSNVQDADMSTLAMQYQQAMTTYEAGIQAAGLVAQIPSIVNYM